MKKIYYYNTLEDDVVKSKNQDYKLKNNYKWIHNNILYKVYSKIIYIIFFIIGFIYVKFILHVTIKNKKILKGKSNYYLFGNHTQEVGDVFIPALITFSKRPYYIVSPSNLGIPILGRFLPALGAIPIPDNIHDMLKFKDSLKYYSKNHPIIVYPEAHVWPYYTSIREFETGAFKLALEDDLEIYSQTTTYRKSKLFKKPKIIVYIDGPYNKYSDLTNRENAKKMGDDVRKQMIKRSKLNNINYVTYKKKDN